jgi:VIT1/CCC1 family predicted Fe2+/Mn2+ transporter
VALVWDERTAFIAVIALALAALFVLGRLGGRA